MTGLRIPARWVRRRSRRDERGFTLVEILVVITIIGLIMALVGPRVINYLGEAKVKAAKIQIESFSSALDLYYLDAGRYPSRRGDDLERAVPQGRRRSQRSLGTRVCVSVARRARVLRHRLLRIGRAGRGNGYRRRHCQLVALNSECPDSELRRPASPCSKSSASSRSSRCSPP